MSRVLLRGVSFAFDDATPLLRSLDLELGPVRYGLAGDNGAGKTTLLSLIAGALAPDEGTITVAPDGAAIAYCPQDVEHLGPDEEALAAATDAASARLRAELDLDPDALTRWPTLSPGERKRWQLAAALTRDPDVLLLDEPTNHLDADARKRLVGALARYRGVGIYVSHDRALLDALTTHTIYLSHGTVSLIPGNYSAA
ncbi:ATP-binding cassette domain-containing protein [Myxococcota bacterium]|nr:ATP-binding cassette domain-containing protein [Myxococcota bacterium]